MCISGSPEPADVFVSSPDQSTNIDICKRFEFDHAKQLMSVLVNRRQTNKQQSNHKNTKDYTVYTKGSFEKVMNLCDPETIPLPAVSVIAPSEETSLPELLDPEPEESAESFGVVAQAATNKTINIEIKNL